MAEVVDNSRYELSDAELHKLQRIELEMLLEIDRICKVHDIKYSLDGGTLLGAVRHKGFIPWDDDIDIIMLRSEYARFRRACKKDLDTERFFLQDYTTDKEYRWGYAKLRRLDTSFIRLGQEHLKQHDGVFLDIFAVDNVPDEPIYRQLHHLVCIFIRKGLYSEVGKRTAKSSIERAAYRVLNKIPRDTYFGMRNNLAKPLHKKRTELISHYTLEYPKRCYYGLPRRCFDEYTKMEFEGYIFPCFKEYDLYLKSYYGDYMTLPPEEDRVPHLFVSAIRLCEPKLPDYF